MRPPGWMRRWPLSLALMTLLAGCASAPLNFAPPSAGTPANGSLAAPASASPSAATLASAESHSVQVGKKTVEVVSVVVDLKCQAVVAPFDVTDNVSELLKLGTAVAGETS